jgi:uncharacterized protein YggE
MSSIPPAPPPDQPPIKKRLSVPLDLRLLVLALLAVIAVMLYLWKPWQAQIKASDRTITVTGDAAISAAPDEYVFSPSYDFSNADKQTALNELSNKSDELVAKLKGLGVPDSGIKTNSSNYSSGIYLPVRQGNENTYTLAVTITVNDKSLAQKVQDYLVTTNPNGAVSPQADFSDAKQKQLQSQARDDATKDARAKAEQSAKNLGFKVAAVKSVSDGSGFGTIPPYCGSLACPVQDLKGSATSSLPSLSVQPGENKLQYSVTVVYYIH